MKRGDDLVSIVIRTLIIYVLLTFSLRVMGKRQLGELNVSELVSTLLISEIAAIPIADTDIPLFNAIIPLFFILSLEIILSTIKNKSEKLKHSFEGKPTYIIYKGRLLQKELSENRISINELLSELRYQGIGDPAEVEYAIIEQNGTLSVIKKGENSMCHPIIIDGEILDEALKAAEKSKKWLEKTLKEKNTRKEDIFLMTVSDDGKINTIKKDLDK